MGKPLGHYEIIEPLGAGGMGEVYRARDTKLDRDVAIKVLPEDFATDADRLARFEREAKLLASLNHANIAAIYGLEDEGDQRFIAMELVEGETLAERIARSGRVEVDEALEIARQIAEALEAAHENGIIHRDLKPANVIVTPDGRVKVLDFGLAKSWEADGSTPDVSPDLSHSPTMMGATRTGVIMGTAAYMSPEQAKGKPLDKRTDIWSFGALLYEMLTSRSAFRGEDVSETLAAILKDEPDLSALPATLPATVTVLLRRCLRKDPARRLHDIADARIEVYEALHEPPAEASVEEQRVKAVPIRLALGLGGLAVGLLIGLLASNFWFGGGGDQEDSVLLPLAMGPPTAGQVLLADEAPVAYGAAAIGWDSPLVAVSPQGEWLVYVGQAESGSMLYRKSLSDHESAQPINGTEGATYAFFSPDGETIGFLTDEQMKRISILGDDLRTITDVTTASRAKWTNDDWIYFAENEGWRLRRIHASEGGGAEHVRSLLGPFSDVSSDGTMVLYSRTARGISMDYGAVALVDLGSEADEPVLESGYDARFAPTGHLVFGRGGDLLAVRFDPATRMPLGDPRTIVRNVAMDSLFGSVQAAFSANGTLVFLTGGDRATGRIVAVDRQGQESLLPLPPRIYGVLDLSPDDTRLVYPVADVSDAIWIYEIGQPEDRELSRGGINGWPIWNDQGDAVAYLSGAANEAERDLMIQPLGQSAQPVVTGSIFSPDDWSPTGEIALSQFGNPNPNIGFWSPGRPGGIEWVDTPNVVQWGVAFSPDGSHIAYASDETGQLEAWVRSREDGPDPRRVSFAGGLETVWCACDEIFFRRGRQFFSAVVQPGSAPGLITWDTAQPVFEVQDFIDTPGISYDVSSDGRLLYAVKRAEATLDTRIHLISNWFGELSQVASTERDR